MSDGNITYLTDVALVTCVVKAGMSDAILKAARDVGALTGAISHHAKGHGARERLGLLGIAVETEREVISLLVSSEQRDTVCTAIYRAGEMGTTGNGYLYVTPLEKVATYVPEELRRRLEKQS
jgi:nitrogen regulatory protein P-II 1